jgi:hypothetical protein
VHTCYSQTGTCPTDGDRVLSGARATDETLTFGGTRGVVYDVTVRVQGQVEARAYSGGADQSNGAGLPADGFYTGGIPAGDPAFNIYAMRVSAPQKDFFFNSIATATDDRVRRSTFDIDFVATIPIQGGASLRMVTTDPNCLTIKNCADPETNVFTPHSFANLSSEIADDIGPQPYNAQFLGFIVQRVEHAP